MSEQPLCEICGEPMPESEQMFKYHGASGPCPKPPLPRAPSDKEMLDWLQARAEDGYVTMCFELDGGVHVTLDPCGAREQLQAELRGKDLVCWCAPQRCHADVLMKYANQQEEQE